MTRLLLIILVLLIVIIVLRATKAPEERTLNPAPRMTRKEALEVLGLGPQASRDEIAKAYKNLIRKVHPDAGGSTYLSAKLNEARRILLE